MSGAESGNMLIMTYAHARASGDLRLIDEYVRRSYSSSGSGTKQLG